MTTAVPHVAGKFISLGLEMTASDNAENVMMWFNSDLTLEELER